MPIQYLSTRCPIMAHIALDDSSQASKHQNVIGVAEFPGDLPSMEELTVWLPFLLSSVDRLGLSAYMRNAEPSFVLQYKPKDLALVPELEASAGEGPVATRLALRVTIAHENSIKVDMKREWTRDQQQKVATIVLDSMRHSAVSRFESMKTDHPQLDDYGVAIDDAYDGIAMAKQLVA